MRDHTGDVRGYHYFNEAWYYRPNDKYLYEFTVGFYSPEGGTSGEFNIKFYMLGGKLVANLDAFDDAWSALLGFHDLIAELANFDEDTTYTQITPDQLIDVLQKCNIVDLTSRTRNENR